MTKLKISVVKVVDPEQFLDEWPVEKLDWMVECPYFHEGQEFEITKDKMPEGFCESAWRCMYPSVDVLINGGNYSYFKEKGVSVVCCNDGLRPVVFKIERIDE